MASRSNRMTSRKRRFVAGSSEDYDQATGISSIEFFAARLDRFRVAPTNHIPTLWPYDKSRCDEKARAVMDAIEVKCRKIFALNDILLERIAAERLGTRGNWEERDTMVFYTTNEDTGNWEFVADQVQDLLNSEITAQGHLSAISPEVRNYNKMYRDCRFKILPDSAEHLLFDGRELEVSDIVLARVPNMSTITFQMRGPIEENDYAKLKPTIIVRIKPQSRGFWDLIRQNILTDLLKAFGPEVSHFEVEIFPGGLMPAVMIRDDFQTPKIHSRLTAFPQVGSSVGPVGSNTSGSLGTFVYFQRCASAPKISCFLTCYHVIESGAQDFRALNLNFCKGIGFGGIPGSDIRVCYPGRLDAAATKLKLRTKLNDGGDVEGLAEESLNIIANYEAMNGIGTVIFASGYNRINCHGHRMDWALVKLDEQVPIQTNKPPRPTEIPDDNLGGELWYVKPDATISSVGGFAHKHVIKRGRTSHVTTGELHSLRGVATWARINRTTAEWEVVQENRSNVEFAKNGDSGSMVIDMNLKWVGMVVAIETTRDSTFITSAKEIIDDIKEWTDGGIITLP